MAVFAPMPSARVARATTVKPGLRLRRRTANQRSRKSVLIRCLRLTEYRARPLGGAFRAIRVGDALVPGGASSWPSAARDRSASTRRKPLVVTRRIPTAAAVRTGLLSPQLRRLFVAVPNRGQQGAAVHVYQIPDYRSVR